MLRNEATKGEKSINYKLADCGWRNLYWWLKNPSPNRAKVTDTIGQRTLPAMQNGRAALNGTSPSINRSFDLITQQKLTPTYFWEVIFFYFLIKKKYNVDV
ncbi:hypothetical protein V6Z12_A12G277800 [Gossypium hirsutum]